MPLLANWLNWFGYCIPLLSDTLPLSIPYPIRYSHVITYLPMFG